MSAWNTEAVKGAVVAAGQAGRRATSVPGQSSLAVFEIEGATGYQFNRARIIRHAMSGGTVAVEYQES